MDGQALAEDDIGKAYEVSKDQLIPITEDDLSGMPLPTARAVEVVAFIAADSVDPGAFGAGDSYARPGRGRREALHAPAPGPQPHR
ncbi:Ku protein [Streptomyces sp. NBC_00691]|uniref:Ku protein n=1 Tax=Streptomyces sp. NBC_00691 TaxID=2903671 RepID=UPI003FA706A8